MTSFAVEAVLLSLDPALHTSGATILIPDYGGVGDEEEHAFDGTYCLHEFGKVTSQSERERYLDSLLDVAEELKLPAVVVAEVWDGPRNRKGRGTHGEAIFVPDKKWNYKTILGMGEGWGRWSAEIEHVNDYLAEKKKPPLFLERVTPNDWRDALFGSRRARDSEQLKIVAQRFFEGIFGYATSADIAESGCIGLYGLGSAAVAEYVAGLQATPKRKRR